MSFEPSENPITNPTRESYTELRPFRFWCQKVLPLVYDDSLSYYELLCKVVDYLNKTMEDVDHMNTDMDNLYSNFQEFQEGTIRIYNELVAYVNAYFDELDVQEEIDNKLDEMVTSGELVTVLQPTIADEVSEWLAEHITPTTPAIDDTLSVTGSGADAKKTGENFANLYSSTALYSIGDIVLYNGNTYKCKENITSPEAFTSYKWVKTNIGKETRESKSLVKLVSEETNNYIKISPSIDGLISQGLKYTTEKGEIKVSGTSTTAGAEIMSEPFMLPAGTYNFGSRGGITGVSLQLRKWVNGSDAGSISQTSGFISITIESDTLCVVRIGHGANANVNTIIKPEISVNNSEYIAGFTAFDGIARQNIDNFKHFGSIPSNSDLNDYIKSGSFGLAYGGEYYHTPVGINNNRFLIVERQKNGESVFQTMIHYNPSFTIMEIYRRFRPNVATGFNEWGKIYSKKDVDNSLKTTGEYIANNTDLNTLTTPNFYLITQGITLVNAPDNYSGSNSILLNLPTNPLSTTPLMYQIYVNYTKNTIHQRVKGDNDTFGVWKLLNDKGFDTKAYIDTDSNLNDFNNAGFYLVLANRTLTNAPADYASSNSLFCIYPVESGTINGQIVQTYLNFTKNTFWQRVKGANGTYSAWKLINGKGFSEFGYIDSNTDLNSLTYEGYYVVLSNRVLTNAPENYNDSNGLICIYPSTSGSAVGQIVQVYYNWNKQTIHARIRTATTAVWSEWKSLEHGIANESEIGKILSYENYSNESTTDNVGTNLDLLVYNVAHYNNDRDGIGIRPDLYNVKLSNLKKLLQFCLPSVAFIAEEGQWLNEDETYSPTKYLYAPSIPHSIANTETNIRTRKLLTNTGTYNLTSTGRYVRYGTLSIDGKNVLLACVHFSLTEDARQRDLNETITFLKSLNIDRMIIAGDFNTQTNTDKQRLATICQQNNLEYANGGYLGWVSTNKINAPLDNILVTSNIIINRFEVLDNWFNDLYSDHYPIRVNVTIL